ncbi:hypothetical protein O181_081702 [Austropuccinia psidii MF-1]|uniref:Uncharacterized protein n=1 Tax=Austropuccinia psidii MF-1 TaxID=1389203 RepID=A0A9Q3FP34_9BASI|nr:hypothetical protein [Austropuccinia psidii MF-1]
MHDATPPASPWNIQAFQERETIKHDTMGQDMTDIIPDAEPKVSSSANFQGIFLSRMEEFGDILNYDANITKQLWKRRLDNINRIYKNQWENLPTKDSHTFLPANFIFESISLVSYDVIAPKPYVAPTSNSTDPLGLEWGKAEYLASCLSKSKQHATQRSIEGGGADNEILKKPHKNLEDLIDTVIHLMIA